MIKCPSCGHGNVDGTQFCEMCGEELEGAKAGGTAPANGAASGGNAQATGLVKCPACDNMNPPDNVVCEVCGTELRPGAGASTPPDPNAAPPLVAPTTTPTATASMPATTPFDPAATSQTTDTSTIASAPAVGAADTATAVGMDAQAPIVSVSSYDPQAADPLANSAAPPVSTLPTSTPDVASPATMGTTPATPTAALEPGRVKMVVEQGMTVGKQFVLGDAEVLVGREDDEEGIYPDVDLSDQDEGYVHRKHAMLKFENGGLSVTHLGGSNKTRVNNKPLADNTPQPVNIGDKVSFGKVVLRVQSA